MNVPICHCGEGIEDDQSCSNYMIWRSLGGKLLTTVRGVIESSLRPDDVQCNYT